MLPSTQPARRGRETLAGGGWIELHEGFFRDHEAQMAALLEELPLRVEEVVVCGKRYPTPRRTSWHGDPGCAYGYSGRRWEPSPWTPTLDRIRAQLDELEGVHFNSLLANHYRDGADAMGAHADDEPELGPSRDDVRIASVSLGAARRFVLGHRATKEKREWSLGGGSVLVMGGPLQRDWVHRVPRTKRVVGPRLNLTFRVVVPRPRIP
ncbi:MAG: alpha-ketoglutarate-dependent dioxygenase AlkB [Sandaracinaceae bacterium]|nr:alpha-ketoglutarate-dependent dioxygenase AlkB [Sandaracinaceae bacterium]